MTGGHLPGAGTLRRLHLHLPARKPSEAEACVVEATRLRWFERAGQSVGMNRIKFMAACAGLMAASAGLGRISDETRTVPARLIHSGYATLKGRIVNGPEGTDQVWAEWVYRSCIKREAGKKYVFRQLVHSIHFGKPVGIYLLTVGRNDIVQTVTGLRRGQDGC